MGRVVGVFGMGVVVVAVVVAAAVTAGAAATGAVARAFRLSVRSRPRRVASYRRYFPSRAGAVASAWVKMLPCSSTHVPSACRRAFALLGKCGGRPRARLNAAAAAAGGSIDEDCNLDCI